MTTNIPRMEFRHSYKRNPTETIAYLSSPERVEDWTKILSAIPHELQEFIEQNEIGPSSVVFVTDNHMPLYLSKIQLRWIDLWSITYVDPILPQHIVKIVNAGEIDLLFLQEPNLRMRGMLIDHSECSIDSLPFVINSPTGPK